MYSRAEKNFFIVNLSTIIALFVLILAGGVVRSSGSGMGCPDWPKCFNQYIPPTDISQLPVGYQTKYVEQRIKKNEKFASLLSKMGYADLATKIRNDESIKLPDDFNVFKTYTEYINRLIGAFTGLLMLATCFFARIFIKKYPKVFWFSLLNLILVFFQAWLGSIVVSTNLLAWVITIHILVALLILAIAIYTYHIAKYLDFNNADSSRFKIGIKILALTSFLITIIQISLGATVRETVDFVVTTYPNLARNLWVAKIGESLNYHRDLALLILLVNVCLFYLILQTSKNNNKKIVKYLNITIILIVLQVIVGIILSHFSLPPTAQALHILLASMLFGSQFYVLLLIYKKPFIKYTIA